MNKVIATLALAAALTLPAAAFAHSAKMDCFDNGDGSVTCQGGFSDGSSASGVPVKVMDASGKVVTDMKFDANGEATFKKPAGDYKVMFDGGAGHQVEIDGKTIVE